MDTIGIFTCELYIKSGGNIIPPSGRSLLHLISFRSLHKKGKCQYQLTKVHSYPKPG